MSMRSRWETSWSIFRASLGVIAREKKLLVFPVLTACLTIVIAVLFLAPIALQPTGYRIGELAHWKAIGSSLGTTKVIAQNAHGQESTIVLNRKGLTYLGLAYFLSMFMATFFNVAFFSEIIRALRGEAVSIARGLRFATQRWRGILLWSLLAGVVGFLIQRLSERFGLVGRLVIAFIGVAWSAAAVFAIPVLVMEPIQNPLDVLRRSAATVKKTWGESLIGYLGLNLAGLVVAAFVVLLAASIGVAVSTNNVVLMPIGCVLAFIALFAFKYVESVAGRVFQCGLYLYASEGSVPGPFNPDMMSAAWKIKNT